MIKSLITSSAITLSLATLAFAEAPMAFDVAEDRVTVSHSGSAKAARGLGQTG